MALTSTVYNLDVSFADADRGVYEDLALRVALHPSETLEFMLTRVLAYCLEYEEGITFWGGSRLLAADGSNVVQAPCSW